jgi:hypothetical protein
MPGSLADKKRWIAIVLIEDDGIDDTGPNRFLKEDEIRAELVKGTSLSSGLRFDILQIHSAQY